MGVDYEITQVLPLGTDLNCLKINDLKFAEVHDSDLTFVIEFEATRIQALSIGFVSAATITITAGGLTEDETHILMSEDHEQVSTNSFIVRRTVMEHVRHYSAPVSSVQEHHS
jgi:hypothetical protein